MDGDAMGLEPPRVTSEAFGALLDRYSIFISELRHPARMVELVDTTDLNSVGP